MSAGTQALPSPVHLDVLEKLRTGYILPPSELNAATAHADELEDEIAELKRRLRQRRLSLKHYSSLISPIRRLPQEVLAYIFERLVVDQEDYKVSVRSQRLALGQVCAYWRRVSRENCPGMWKCFVLDIEYTPLPHRSYATYYNTHLAADSDGGYEDEESEDEEYGDEEYDEEYGDDGYGLYEDGYDNGYGDYELSYEERSALRERQARQAEADARERAESEHRYKHDMHVRSVASALATMLHLPLHSPPQIEVTIRAGPTFRNDLYAPLIQNKGRIRSLSIVGQRSDIDEFISRMSAHTWPELQVLSVSHTNTAPVVSPPSYERHILRIPNIRELTHFRPKLAMGCRHTTLTTLITSFASRHNCEEVLLQCTVLESLFITHVDEDMRPVPFPDVTEVGSLRTLKLSRCAAVARTTLDSLSFPGLDTLSLVEAPPSTSHPGCGIPTMSGAPAIISRLLERSKCRLRAIIVEVAGISRPVLSEILIAANTVTSVSLGTILPYKQEMDPIVETFTPQQDKVVLPRLRKIELTIDQFPMLAPVYGIVRSRKDAGYMPLDELRMNIQGVDRHALRRWERGRLDVKKHLQLAVRWAEAGVIKKISVVTLVDGVDLVQQLMDDSLSIPTNPRRCCSA